MSAQSSSHCRSCQSANQSTFNGEIAIHFPGLEGLDKPIVWVFPKLLVCLNCGFTEFAIPEAELRRLVESMRLERNVPRGRLAVYFGQGTLCLLGFAGITGLNSTTDKMLPGKNFLHGSEEFTGGITLQDITLRSGAQSCPYYVFVVVGGKKDNLCSGSDLEDAFRGFQSIRLGRPMSSKIKSGCSSSAMCTASNPSVASPTTCKSCLFANVEQMNRRNSS